MAGKARHLPYQQRKAEVSGPPMDEAFLSLSNISKSYAGVRALSQVQLDIRSGEVHCLVGENGSGKSTLIKVIAGIVQPDPGASILIDGRHHARLNPIDSMLAGIQVIYQDLSLFPNLTVAENIAINQCLEEKRVLVRRSQLVTLAREAMSKVGTELDPDSPVGELPIARQQIVAICRSITRGGKLIVMDEPTSSLGKRDIEYLFSIIRKIRDRGLSVLFVGHKLNEIFEIADRVSILRDGKKVGTSGIGQLNKEQLIELMTGRKFSVSTYAKSYPTDRTLLEVHKLSKKGQFADVDLRLYPGEILGVTGLIGSGRTELALALFGLNPPDSGRILVEGRECAIGSADQAVSLGICYLPENRLTQGLFMEHTISRNMIVTVIRQLARAFGLLDGRRIKQVNERWIRELNIRTPSAELQVKQLSGGNQQRVVLAKWLERKPKILILDGPTIGVDVGAKQEIHQIIKSLAESGIGILMISDEVAEVVAYSHRILVMKEGRIGAELDAAGTSESEILEQLNTRQEAR
jgi:simple sugar transport system ATP-binding protein